MRVCVCARICVFLVDLKEVFENAVVPNDVIDGCEVTMGLVFGLSVNVSFTIAVRASLWQLSCATQCRARWFGG